MGFTPGGSGDGGGRCPLGSEHTHARMGICAGSHGTRDSLCNLATAEMKGEAKHRGGGLSVFLLPFSREIALA